MKTYTINLMKDQSTQLENSVLVSLSVLVGGVEWSGMDFIKRNQYTVVIALLLVMAAFRQGKESLIIETL